MRDESANIASSFAKSLQAAKLFAVLFFLQACSQIVILQPGSDDIEVLDETPVVTFSHITPGEFSATTSEVRLFGSSNEATALVRFYSDSSCSTLLESAAPLEWESLGARLTLAPESTTSLHAQGSSESGIRGECTHMVNFTHASIAPIGLTLLNPASSPANDPTPSFAFQVEGITTLDASDKITLHATPDCSGPALVIDEATSGLTVLSGVGTSSGTLSLSASTPLTPGTYVFTAKREIATGHIMCSTGHTDPAEGRIAYEHDVAPPAVVPPADLNIGTGENLNSTNPTFTGDPGSAEPGSTVDITIIGDTTGSCSTTVAADGSWSCTVTGLIGGPNQSVTAQIVVTDPAGNSAGSTDVPFTIDTVPPSSVVVSGPVGGSSGNDTTPTVSGNGADPGATVEASSGASSCTTVADGGGNWSCELSPALGNGAHTIDVVQIDEAGNSSSIADVSITIDTDVPSAPIVAMPGAGSLSNDTTPTVSGIAGSAEAGANVNVTVTGGGGGSCSTTAAGDGSWSCDVSTLTGGASVALNFSVTQTDTASNTSPATAFATTLDTATPAIVALAAPSGGSFSNDTTPTVSGNAGSAEAGNAINVTVTGGGGGTCSTTAAGDGSWSCDVSTLTGGANVLLGFNVTQTDAAGNSSTPAAVGTTLDTVDPSAPAIASPGAGDTLGDTTPTVSGLAGSAEAGATVNVSVSGGGDGTCSTTAAGDGSWSCDVAALAGGSAVALTFSVTQTDLAGNSGSAAVVAATLDTSAPSAPVVASPSSGSFTNDTTPTVSGSAGSAEAGATVDVAVTGGGDGTCSTTAAGDGSWSCDVSTLTGGANVALSFSVTQTDTSLNTSSATVFAVTLDTVNPAAPTVASPSGGSFLNDTTPSVAGSAEAGATVDVSVTGGGDGSCSTTAAGDGSWSCDVSTLTGGASVALSFSITQTDPAGNAGSATVVAATLDTSSPSAPAIASPSGGSLINDTTPTVSGNAGSVEAGATVNVAVTGGGDGTCSTTAAGDGSWSCDVSTLTGGASVALSFSVTQTDAAGNEGSASVVAATLDTVNPTAPPVASPTNSEVINDTEPLVAGTAGSAEAGATVNVSVTGGGGGSCSTTAAGDGSWSCEVSTLTGGASVALSFSVNQTDAAGNTGSATVIAATLDTAAPAAPTVASPSAGSFSNDTTPTVSGNAGSAEAGNTINVTVTGGGGGTCSTTAAGDGSWSCDVSTLTGGASVALSFSVTQTDSASNSSSAAVVATTLDTVDPAAPVIASPGAGDTIGDTTPTVSGLAGSVESGATVNVTVTGGGGGSCSTTAAGDGSWSCDVSTLTGGASVALSFSATQTDLAGNSGTAAVVAATLDTSAPSAPVVASPTSGSFTNDTTPTVSGLAGSAEVGATVDVTVTGGGGGTCSTTAAGDGSWSCDVSTLTGGPNVALSFSLTQTDTSLNTSSATVFAVTLDTGNPAAPTVASPSGGSLINDTTPTVTGSAGSAEAGASVDVTVTGGGGGTCSTTAAGDGSWSCDVSTLTGGGSVALSFSVTQTDLAGNLGSATVLAATLDTSAPAAPIAASPAGGAMLNDTTPTASGNAGSVEAGATVDVAVTGGGGGTCSTTAAGDGSWSCDVSTLTGGASVALSFSITQTDTAGNTGSATIVAATLDTALPAAPVVASPAGSSISNDTTPTVSGSAGSVEAGNTVNVTVTGGGGGTCSTTAAGDGSWSCDVSTLTGGASVALSFSVTQTDAASNTSSATVVATTLDTSAPAAPVVAVPAASAVLSDTTPTVSGAASSAEAGNTINVTVTGGGGGSCSTTAAGDGSWSCDVSTLTGGASVALSFNVTQTDSATNTSSATVIAATLDTSAPAAPVVASPTASSFTNDTTPSVSGSAGSVEAGNTVNVTVTGGGGGSCSTTAAGDGSWSCDVSTLTGGASVALSFSVTQTDAASNTSSATVVAATLDTSAPAAPIVAAPSASSISNDTTPTVSGAASSAEAGNTINVTVTGGGGGSCSTTAAGDGSWSCDVSTLTGGASVPLSFSVTQTDAASNTSSASVVATTLDTVQPGNLSITSPTDSSVTNDTQFTVSGSGLETGSTVTVTVTGGGGAGCTTATDEGAGAWSCTIDSTLTGGASVALTVAADQEDAAGNTTASPASHNVVLDTLDPAAPVISAPAESATLTDGDVEVSGTAEMNAAVNVTVDGESADCSDTANGAGAWSCTLDETLAIGTYTVRVTQTDAAGNGPSTADTHSISVVSPTYQWDHQAYLKAPNASANENFGESASISGDTVIVGSVWENSATTVIINGTDLSSTDDLSSNSGAAYIFQRTGSSWAHQAYLKAPNATSEDEFGNSVGVSGDTAVVGAHHEDSSTNVIINGDNLSATDDGSSQVGAAYVFTRSGSTWTHEAYLKASNAQGSDYFARSVAIDNNTVAVGAIGEDSDTTSIIHGIDLSSTNNGAGQSGAVYVFTRSGSNWTQQAYLKGPNAHAGGFFGSSLNLSGDLLVVGSEGEKSSTTAVINGSDLSSTNTDNLTSGAAYVFRRSNNVWTHEAYLKPPRIDAQDHFGYSVSVAQNTIAVGARWEDSSTNLIINGSDLSSVNNDSGDSGAVYVFSYSGSTWSHEAYLKASNPSDNDEFGASVAVDGDLLVVGAAQEDGSLSTVIHGGDLSGSNNAAAGAGAAYVYRRNGSTWENHAYLKAPNAQSGDHFGSAVGISGNTVLITAYFEDSATNTIIHGEDLSSTDEGAARSGAAYVFTLSDTPSAPGIALNTPSSSPGNDSTPSFTVDFSSESLIATDIIELYGKADCGGEALDINEATIGNTQLSSNTSSSITLTVAAASAQAEGSNVYSVKRTNADGYTVCSSANGAPAKQFASYTYDNTPPGNVTISSPADSSVINDNQFTVSGAGLTVGETVNVTVTGGGGSSCSTSTDLGAGAWSCTLDSALTGGASVAIAVTAEQEDSAGNTSLAPVTHNIFLDTVGPGAPAISAPADNATLVDGDINVSGTAEMNATVNVSVDGETADCSDTANGAGAWSCTLDETLIDGSYTIRVTQTDAAGNGPSTADTHNVTVDIPYLWSHQAYLKAPNTSNMDFFGRSVSISGNTAMVGAAWEDSNTSTIIHGSDLSSTNDGINNTGAVYVFARSGTTWSHQAYLKAPNPLDTASFGHSISLEGHTAIIGAQGEISQSSSIINGSDLSSTDALGNWNGAAYVFVRSGSTWSHQAYLKAPNNSDSDQFGLSVALSNDTVVVGAHGEGSDTTAIIHGSDLSGSNNSGTYNGAAYVFVRDGSTWSHQAYLKAPNSLNLSYFGQSVDISGDTIIVGASGEASDTTAIIHGSDLSSTNTSANNSGAAYVFTRSAGVWSHQAYLKAPNTSGNDRFAQKLSLHGDTAIIGAHQETSTTTAIVSGGDLSSTNNDGSNNGAAYVFVRNGSTWTHEAYLKSPNHSNGDNFGQNLHLEGDMAIVGAIGEASNTSSIIHGSDLSATNDGGSGNGAAYVFQRNGSTWSLHAYLKAPNSTNGANFGSGVAIGGDTLVVTATNESSNTNSIINGADLSSTNTSGSFNGAAYVFTLSDMPPAPSIIFTTPGTALGSDSTPGFDIELEDGSNLLGSQTLEIYGQADCGGSPLDFDEANGGSSDLTGPTSLPVAINISSSSAQPEGTRTYSAKISNSDGYSVCSNANSDATKQSVSYTYDGTPPGNVTITAPTDSSFTNDTQFTVTGTGLTAGETVNVTVTGGGGSSCSTTTDLGSGAWSCTLDSALTGGAAVALTVTAEQEDAAGNTSPAPDSISLTLDTSEPGTGTITSPANNGIVSGTSLEIVGTAEANASVAVEAVSTTANCSTTADGSGNWSCTLDETLSPGGYTIQAIQTDQAGNIHSGSGAQISITVTTKLWSHQAYLKAPNNDDRDFFGSSAAISGDTIVVGAWEEASTTSSIIHGADLSSTNNSGDSAGAAYVFHRSGTTWSHQAYLKAPNAQADDEFGRALAISGDTIVVGAETEDSSTSSIIHGSDLSSTDNSAGNSGAVYVFRRSGSTWSHEAYLKSPSPDVFDNFGSSTSISGDTIVVGADGEHSNTTSIIHGSDLSAINNDGWDNGAAYVFRRSGSTWAHEAYLKAPNSGRDDFFGFSTAVSGDTVVVSAPFEDSNITSIVPGANLPAENNLASASGAVYVYKRGGTTWSVQAYLKAPNADAGDTFGRSVAISGDTIVVGADQEKSTTTSIIHGSDLSAANNDGGGNGALYVFKRNGNLWSHEAYLKTPNGGGPIGRAVSISGDTLVTGAIGEGSSITYIIHGSDLSAATNSGVDRGAAYVFTRSGSTWSHEAFLKAPNATNSWWNEFGISASASGNTIVVGAHQEESDTTAIIHGDDLSATNSWGSDNGAAYVFVLSGIPSAPGIANNSPASSSGTDRTPSFTIDFSGESLVVDDVIELYSQMNCGGEAVEIDEATSGNTQLSNSTASSVTLTVATASQHATKNIYYYSVKRTNANGHSVCSDANSDTDKQWVAYQYTVTPPGAVTITSPLDEIFTSDTQFTVSGTGLSAGSTVNVSVTGSGTAGCSTSTNLGGGSWNCTLSSALSATESATLTIEADQSNASGISSGSPDYVYITLDTFTPTAPVILNPADGSTHYNRDVTVTGTAEPWASLAVSVDGETADCSVEADVSGNWSCLLDESLSSGGFRVRAVQTDRASNGPSVSVTSDIAVAIEYDWSLQAYLKAPNTSSLDRFGYSLDLSGDTAIVGSYNEQSTTTTIIHGSNLSATNDTGAARGAAYVFTRSGSTWTHQAYLKAPNAEDNAWFGWSVSIDGDTAVVGANAESSNTTSLINGTDLSSTNTNGSNNGAAYVFQRSSGTWTHQAYLKAPNNSDEDQFGKSVSIHDDTIVVGAPNEDSSTTAIIHGADLSSTNDINLSSGAAYVFRRSNGTWYHEAYLKAPNSSASDNFGEAVALNGDTVIIGASQERSSTTAIINGADLSATNNSASGAGAAYIFKRTGGTWSLEAYLKSPNNGSFNRSLFGKSITLSGDTAIVGAIDDNSTTTTIVNGDNLSGTNHSGTDIGAAHIFKRTGSTWSYEAYLKAPNAADNDEFGKSVAVDGNIAAVSSSLEDSNSSTIIHGDNLAGANNAGTDNGAVYIYQRNGTTWSHLAYIKAPNSSDGDWFGYAVRLSGGTLLVSGHGEDSTSSTIIHGDNLSATNDSGDNNGAAYIFTFSDLPAAPGIVLDDPTSTVAADSTPRFTVDFSGDSLLTTDLIELYRSAECSGDPVEFEEATSGTDLLNGSTATSLTVTVASSDAQLDGENHYSVLRTNAEGYSVCSSANSDAEKQFVTYYFDSTMPGNVTINSPADGAYTSDTQFTVSGSGLTPGDTVNVTVTGGGGSSCSTSTNLGQGSWSCTLTSALSGGASVPLVISADQSDAFGNDSPLTDTVNVTLDTVAPGAPTITTPANSSTLSSGIISVSGTADVDASVAVSVDGETADCSVAVDGSGNWSCQLDEILFDASYTIRATQTDAAGNGPSPAATVSVTVASSYDWTHQAYLKPPETTNVDLFSYGVSISGDAAIVGAPAEDSNTTAIIHGTDLSSTNDSGSNNGAAYVFRRSGSTWTHEAYLKSPTTTNSDQFGYLASIDGDTALVAANGDDSNSTAVINGTDLSSTNDSGFGNGAVHVFRHNGSTWSYEAYLKAPNTTNEDYFGASISLSGNTAVVGSSSEDSTTTSIIHGADLSATNNSGDRNGAVYVFTRTGSTWSHEAYLKAPKNVFRSYFGSNISISGDTVIAGAYGERSGTTDIIHGSDLSATNFAGNNYGAAFVFKRTDGIWAHEAYLKAPNAAADSYFGTSVSISGDTALVASPYEDSTTTSIIHGENLASGTDSSGNQNGAVYVFRRNAGTWSHEAYLKAPNNTNSDQFGTVVSIDGDIALVTSRYEDSNTTSVIQGSDLSSTNDSGSSNGAAYVFVRAGAYWTHVAYFKAPNNTDGDQFGFRADLNGGTALVGAPAEASTTTAIINGTDLSSSNNSGDQNGAVYVYTMGGLPNAPGIALNSPASSPGTDATPSFTVDFSGSSLVTSDIMELYPSLDCGGDALAIDEATIGSNQFSGSSSSSITLTVSSSDAHSSNQTRYYSVKRTNTDGYSTCSNSNGDPDKQWAEYEYVP